MITAEILKAIMHDATMENIVAAVGPLNNAMAKYGIDTPQRVAMFLAQIAHESGQLLYRAEIASGSAYEGRKDLGNTSPGDGVKYKGRGWLQTTGKANYVQVSKALGIDAVNHPELLSLPVNAAMSAGLFWKTRGLNAFADKGDIDECTHRINGGYNGLDKRIQFYNNAKKVFQIK